MAGSSSPVALSVSFIFFAVRPGGGSQGRAFFPPQSNATPSHLLTFSKPVVFLGVNPRLLPYLSYLVSRCDLMY